MQRFKSARSAQKFLSTHAAVCNIFNVQRHLISAQSHRVLRAAASGARSLRPFEVSHSNPASRRRFDNVTAPLSVIRRWHYRDHFSIREISRRIGLSRNTVRKYLRSDSVEPKFAVPVRPSRLDGDQLRRLLEPHHPPSRYPAHDHRPDQSSRRSWPSYPGASGRGNHLQRLRRNRPLPSDARSCSGRHDCARSWGGRRTPPAYRFRRWRRRR